MQKRKGVVLAAPKSGSGKTLIACALIEALKEAGVDVCAFKCGPDYIDPMFHRTILGVPGRESGYIFYRRSKDKRDIYGRGTGRCICSGRGCHGTL